MILHFCCLNSSCSIQNIRSQLNNRKSLKEITFFRNTESPSMAAPKGKQGTRGAKQIVEENTATLHFYRNMALGSTASSLLLNFIFFELSKLSVIMSVVTIATLLGAYQFMAFMSRAKLSDTGAVLDSGNDLNMEGGIAENAKDLIILSSGTLLLAVLSNYFWFLLLLVPIRAVWMLWGTVIQPWLASRNEVEPETDEKKQRKMERKIRRMR